MANKVGLAIQAQAVFHPILKEVATLARAESEIKLPMGINQDIADQGHTIQEHIVQVKVEQDLLKVDVLGNTQAGITWEDKDKEFKGDKGSERTND